MGTPRRAAGGSVNPVRVLYIGGCGRSGSTLLDRSLGQLEGICAVGELVHIWQRGLLGNHLCGCATPFQACPFWTKVGDLAFGGWQNIDVAEVLRLQRSVDRNRFIPLLLEPRLSPSYHKRLREYVRYLARLYRAIADAAEVPIVVDSSKHASFAFLIRHVPDVDLRVVHLVRDSRGVAHSWTKSVRRPEVTDRTELMPQRQPIRIALAWSAYNAAFHVLRSLGTPTLFVRYESFVRDPAPHLRHISSFVGAPAGDVPISPDGKEVELRPTHSVAGNPMRFRQGWLRLRIDEAWRTDMDPRTRSLVYALTWPLMRSYGYNRQGVAATGVPLLRRRGHDGYLGS